jgi:Tol biopolymer transport system component
VPFDLNTPPEIHAQRFLSLDWLRAELRIARRRGPTLNLALVLLAVGGIVGTASATPQARGDLILYTSDSAADGSREIHAISVNGGGPRRLTRNSPQGYSAAWSPRGGRLAFIAPKLQRTGDRWTRGRGVAIWTVDPTGRRPRRVRAMDDASQVQWSPDGRRLAVIADGDLYVMRPDGSSLVRLTTDTVGALDFAWSPDSRRLIVSEWRGDRIGAGISAVSARGGELRRITPPQTKTQIEDEQLFWPAGWAPNGRQVAFVRETGQYVGDAPVFLLIVANADGSHAKRLARGLFEDARWSPDGRRIAVISEQGIEVIQLHGRGRRTVGNPPGVEFALAWSGSGKDILTASSGVSGTRLFVTRVRGDGFQPLSTRRAVRLVGVRGDQRWAPNGRAFVQAHIGDEFREPLAYLELLRAGGRPMRLLKPAIDGAPSWSPTGAQYAFERQETSGFSIYVASADGSRVRRVGAGRAPLWSPDGRSLSFLRGKRIFIARASGRGAREVGRGFDVAWSPESDSLAFVAGDAIWLVAREGGPARRVVGPDLPDPHGCARSIGKPTWAPSGDRVAFLVVCSWDYGGEGDMYTVHTDGSGLTPAAFVGFGFPDSFVWSPDGRTLALSDGIDIYVLDADGGNRRKIGEGHSLAWSPDSTRLAFVRDDDIWVMDADGTNARALTKRGDDRQPVWEPSTAATTNGKRTGDPLSRSAPWRSS